MFLWTGRCGHRPLQIIFYIKFKKHPFTNSGFLRIFCTAGACPCTISRYLFVMHARFDPAVESQFQYLFTDKACPQPPAI